MMASVDVTTNLPLFLCPRRPAEGNEGRIIKLRANHFPIIIKAANIFQYDVTITPDRCPRKVNR